MKGTDDLFFLTLQYCSWVEQGIQLPPIKVSQQEVGYEHPYLRQNMIPSTFKTTKDDLQTDVKKMLIKGQEKFRAWEPHNSQSSIYRESFEHMFHTKHVTQLCCVFWAECCVVCLRQSIVFWAECCGVLRCVSGRVLCFKQSVVVGIVG